jgi:hypothetical protein
MSSPESAGNDQHLQGSRDDRTPEPRVGDVPPYMQLDRKELRIRSDQTDALSVLTRQLNRARGNTGERITDNTLIRVAIDLLLLQKDQLKGATEAELRYSVTYRSKEA